ncbi:hypothetical protein TH66_00265 [Carbonactinospora thermoautotrophica]|uniref:Uncharacterized protein n=1 Tax=Carbonactinospora thermoautotrophica TaxID=1469144 RepID=A0A132NIC4_9ACTN|nr:hypothetical protein [Carbonactinospora thermoautotrophica]KWX05984.1 hypothetical protein TH66_00265 [Carbonactinospora thermoautotrophica]KWX09849.1 hypothetical protein TR74_07170 [Carbonactinospora thermoautotrophica]
MRLTSWQDLQLDTRPLDGATGDPYGLLCDVCGDRYPQVRHISRGEEMCGRCARGLGQPEEFELLPEVPVTEELITEAFHVVVRGVDAVHAWLWAGPTSRHREARLQALRTLRARVEANQPTILPGTAAGGGDRPSGDAAPLVEPAAGAASPVLTVEGAFAVLWAARRTHRMGHRVGDGPICAPCGVRWPCARVSLMDHLLFVPGVVPHPPAVAALLPALLAPGAPQPVGLAVSATQPTRTRSQQP